MRLFKAKAARETEALKHQADLDRAYDKGRQMSQTVTSLIDVFYDQKLSIAIAIGLIAAVSITAQAQDFKVCKSKFALCTVAQCDPIPGNDKQVSCHCTVNTSYSAGQAPCQGVKITPQGQQIGSRYYPVRSYAICSNDRPWAWCLDKPCIIDKNNPEAAACTCDVVKNLGDYVIVTSAYTPATCTTNVISSATVQQITQVTDYLKTKSKVLPPFPIKVVDHH
jgi:hypothetical protein